MRLNRSKVKTNPGFLFAVLLSTILATEIGVMFLLPILLPAGTSALTENIIDGILLTLIVAPVLWKILIVPIRGDAHQAQLRAQSIINSAHDGILSLDKNGLITAINPSMQKILGLSMRDIVKIDYRDLLPNLKQLNLNDIVEEDFEYTNLSGEKRFLRLKNVKVYSDEGPLNTLFIEDETEKKQAQQALDVQQARAESSARLATLGEMAAGIAHEVSTPLTVLKMQVSQLKKQETQLANIERINKMDKMVDRISGTIKGMKGLMRDGSKDPMELVPLKQIIEDVTSLTREKFYNQAVDLRIGEVSNDTHLNCRAVELGQVILNFLSNAYDAIEKNTEKWVELKTLTTNDKIEIIITDSGTGISKEIVEKIFNPFFTTKAVGKGTGLGLSISMEIIKNHGGVVRINHECPNTQFVITLPITKQQSQQISVAN